MGYLYATEINAYCDSIAGAEEYLYGNSLVFPASFMSSNCTFPHKRVLLAVLPGTLFIFDDFIKVWFTIVMLHIKITLNWLSYQLPCFQAMLGVF